MLKKYAFPLSLLFISILSGWALWWSTPAGLGLTNDSAAYISGARSLLQGTGYAEAWLINNFEPITHYPPLLSITLAAFGWLGLDPLRAVRLLNILLLAGNTFLLGLLAWRMTRSYVAGIFLALIFALNEPIFGIHAYALSEPLFLFFTTAAFLCFDYSFQGESPRQNILSPAFFLLFFAGFCVGLAFLTRYSGLALLATFVSAFFLLRTNWTSRIARSGVFLFGVMPLAATWLVRNALVSQNATNRTIAWHPIPLENFELALFNISNFIMPYEPFRQELIKSGLLPWLLATLILFLLGWLFIRARDFWFNQRFVNILLFTTVLYIFGYLSAILASMSLFDASTKFQHRILAPFYVSWFILLTAGLGWLWQQKQKVLRFMSVFLSVSILLLSASSLIPAMQNYHHAAGLGYGSWRWRDAEVMQMIKELPPEVIVYSNSPPAVYFGTNGRPSLPIPTSVDPGDNEPRENYQADLALMREKIFAGEAVLVLFQYSPQLHQEYTANMRLVLRAQNNALFDGEIVK